MNNILKMEKKLSVIVPIYNMEKYLKQCIESILNQSLKEIELILVDDGSTDGSDLICDEYACKDKRVKVIHQENKGVIEARYKGLQESSCKYVTFVDGDDFIDRTAYNLALESMEKDIDIIIFGISYYYRAGKQTQRYSDFLEGIYNQAEIEQKILPKVVWNYTEDSVGMHPSLCNKIVKKDLIMCCYEQLPNSRFWYGEDNIIFYLMLKKAKTLEIKEYSYYYSRLKGNGEVPAYFADDDYFAKLLLLYNYLVEIFKDSPEILKQVEYFYIYSVSSRKRIYGPQKEIIRHLFPFDRVDKGERVILYGAGIVGQAYMDQIKKLSYCRVVLWVDRNYKMYDSAVVFPVDAIRDISYDKVVIAIADGEIKDTVQKDLITLGVPENQIIK